MTDLESVKRAHTALTIREHAYLDTPSDYNHQRIVQAQRIYYRRLAHHLRATTPPDEARVKRCEAMRTRAQYNRRRQPNDPQWQLLTLSQVRRARDNLTRARAIQEYNTPPPTPPKPPTKPARLPRVPHPVTGRAMYYDHTTNTYHRQHPTPPHPTPDGNDWPTA